VELQGTWKAGASISDKLRRMLLLGIWHLPEGVSFARRSHHNIGLGSGRSPCECHNRRQIEATRARTSKRWWHSSWRGKAES